MDETTRDPIIEAALNRYVPESGWNGDWSRVVAHPAPRSLRVWLMGTVVVAVAGTTFALLIGASLHSRSTAEPPAPPAATWSASLAATVGDDGRISLSPSVNGWIASGQETINRCLVAHGATRRVYGDGSAVINDTGGQAHLACRGQIHEASAYQDTGEYRFAEWSRARAHAEMRACLARETGTIPTVKLGEPVSASAVALRTCVAVARVAARSVTSDQAPASASTSSPPHPRTVDLVIEGERVAIPETMTLDVDYTGSQLLGTVGGLRYVSGTRRDSGDPCFVSFTAGGGGTIGCDPRDQLVAKGGWLISLRDEGDTRRGLVIVPSVDGDLVFTTTPFERRKPGSTIIVRVGAKDVTRTIP